MTEETSGFFSREAMKAHSDGHNRPLGTWVVVAPDGVRWVGLAKNEHHAWQFALGWPDQKEIADTKALGWYAVEGNLTWRQP